MTTHRQRIEALKRGEIIDRAPVALWRHYPVDDQSASALAEAHLAWQATYDFDLVKITPASSFSVRDWGVEDAWQGDAEGTRHYTKCAIHNPADWERLEILDPSAPSLAQQLDCIRRIRAGLTDGTPLLQTIFNPLSQAKHLAGEITLANHLQSAPDAVVRALTVIARSTAKFIEAAAEAGIDGIFYAVQHAQAGVMSRRQFLELSHDADVALLGKAAGLWFNILHIHGEQIYFDAMTDYPAHAINWHDRESGPSLREAADRWNEALSGGISRKTLVLGTPADVAAEAHQTLRGPCGRRILLSTGCVIPLITPHGNIMAAKQAVETA